MTTPIWESKVDADPHCKCDKAFEHGAFAFASEPDRRVVEWFGKRDEGTLFLSALTLGEIQKGIVRLPDGARKDAIQGWLDTDLRNRFSDRLLPIDEETALTWGLIQAEAEKRGRPIPTIDGLLGATAVAKNLIVATRDIEDIHRTGARTVNPWLA